MRTFRFGKSSGKLETTNGTVVNWSDSDEDVTEYDSLQNWMTCLPTKLCQMPIWDLTLPGMCSNSNLSQPRSNLGLDLSTSGSHDSGSYALESKSGIAPDKPDLRKWWMRVFGFICYPVVKKWTITQTLNLQQQLASGVRYFDLRAAPKPNDIDLYFVHGLYGPRIVDMCTEINQFLDLNPKEIVVIHVQHFVTAGTEQQLHLLLEMVRIFRNKVCPYQERSDISLEYMWSQGYQVFLFFPCPSKVRSNYLWPADNLPNPWANTTNADCLNQFLTDKVKNRNGDRFYVTQGVLTPTDEYVKKHLFSSLYRRLVTPCNDTIAQWLNNREAGPRGPNIVMTDFIQWNDFEIPRKVVSLNYRLL